jgi:hypothetical protein
VLRLRVLRFFFLFPSGAFLGLADGEREMAFFWAMIMNEQQRRCKTDRQTGKKPRSDLGWALMQSDVM